MISKVPLSSKFYGPMIQIEGILGSTADKQRLGVGRTKMVKTKASLNDNLATLFYL